MYKLSQPIQNPRLKVINPRVVVAHATMCFGGIIFPDRIYRSVFGVKLSMFEYAKFSIEH